MNLADLHTTPSWQDHAACRGLGNAGDFFFPEKADNADEGKRICLGCPVQTECLQHAIDNNIKHGTWGGMSPNARSQQFRTKRKHST